MSNYNKVRSKIKELSNNKKLNEQVIRKIKGSYHLYNTYKITNNNGIWEVRKYDYFVHGFESSATATSWCLADKFEKYMDANNLILIDRRIQFKKDDVYNRSIQLNQRELDNDQKEISISRITYDLHVCRNLKAEIEKNFLLRLNTHNLQDFKI